MSIAESPILTRENYDADTHYVRHSAIEDFIKSPSIYHHRWILGNDREETDAMRIGSALHCLVLENQSEYDARFCVAPECDRRTKIGKEKWEEFLRESSGKTVLTPKQSDLVNELTYRLANHSEAQELLSCPTATEEVVTWNWDGTECKCRLDGRIGKKIVFDLKSAANPYESKWVRDAIELGYHRQADWYLQGARETFKTNPRFVFIVIGKELPHDIFLRYFDDEAMELANRQNKSAIARLNHCRETNQWDHPDTNGVRCLSLPRWAFTQEEYA